MGGIDLLRCVVVFGGGVFHGAGSVTIVLGGHADVVGLLELEGVGKGRFVGLLAVCVG